MAERKEKTKKEFEEILLEVRKVTRVTTGGRRMSFRAIILVGDKKGKIGLGLSKGADVTSAVKKASNEAYKNMFNVPITKEKSVPYAVTNKYKACSVRLLPATHGTGLKAGSSVRSVLDLAGYENILSKIIGSNNKLNNAIATINALTQYKHQEHFMAFTTEKKEAEKVEKEDSKKLKKVDNNEDKKNIKKETISKDSVEKKPVEKKEIKKSTKDKLVAKKDTTKKDTTSKKTTSTKTATKVVKK
ncbi:MAG: 30S ribosomal protein S5 [Candidatus Absconditabacterales bacterium]|nr:30S ribosomal protein S5 [Candidatus Absconditabacterales bacterium]